MDLLRLQDILTYGVGQGFKEATCFAHPRSQRCAIKLDACTAIDACLSIQRGMVSVFGNHYLSQQTRPGHTPCDWAGRSSNLHDFGTATTR
ncbi:hypothetical protein AWB69_09262 [Caballeronia udeis]|uniref:Uncharacterized protein n=1 Tax=Caballeronia udeis TaxID=1232866 RepID=A0A158K3A9_9BURK|nr:hypothetical protein AWB69_09262 [Caballeronia udeis]